MGFVTATSRAMYYTAELKFYFSEIRPGKELHFTGLVTDIPGRLSEPCGKRVLSHLAQELELRWSVACLLLRKPGRPL